LTTGIAPSSSATKSATLTLDGKTTEFPVVVGTEQEHGIDIARLRSETGYITLDPSYGNTGSCESKITFIDGERGILRYRGIPIEQLAENSTFVETAWLLIFGELPTKEQLARFSARLSEHSMLHEGLLVHFNGFPSGAPPMAILSAMINALGCYHPDVLNAENTDYEDLAARLISQVRTIAAASYKVSVGHPIIYPKPHLSYCANFLHMMFSKPYAEIDPDPEVVRALNQILLLHADHEQNCSTSTVRMVGSSGANLFASTAAGVCALWGWRHGGANVAVLNMLEYITRNKISCADFVKQVKNKEVKLMGFGHRVYKNFDPRARILAAAAEKILPRLGVKDPMLDLARQLQDTALSDSYFKDRSLYPNVDFYSGILMRAMGIPVNMFTVMFAIGRMPGWIAQYKELVEDPNNRIDRPRQIYTGYPKRDYVPMDRR
jgi:citrate synthase